MENNTLTISDAASVLMGAGIAKLDDIKVGLGLVAAGVLLKIVVAVLQKRGYDVRLGKGGAGDNLG